MTEVTLKQGEGRYLNAGGLWIYDNEIAKIEGRFRNGDIVSVKAWNGYGLGKGYINQNSKIRIRMLTRNPEEEMDELFFRERIRNAWQYRLDTSDTSSCRVIFGEADFLPGLVADKYEDVLVFQFLTLGMDRMKEKISALTKEVLEETGFPVRGMYERSDASERVKEGLEKVKGFIGAPFDPCFEITENGIRYRIDVENGQKTGFFLDQKYNRLAVRTLCRGKTVLDCFTNIGTFALNAGLAGAKEVTGLDISASAIKEASENAARNGLSDRVHFREANVLDELPRLISEGAGYDVVILDPPAFTKSRESIKKAVKGYREINMQGLRLVRPGGYLATCSCSHFMPRELFEKTVLEAAHTTHRRLRQVEARTQGRDHPFLWGAEESSYLKFYIFQVW